MAAKSKPAPQLKPFHFQPGQSGNPGGKPVGARNRLNAAFLNALSDEFEKSGKVVIATVAREDPATFMRVMAGILPKEIDVSHPLDELTDEQLDAAATAVRAIITAQGAGKGARPKKTAKSA